MPATPGDQQAPRPQEVFISYSRKDKEFVRRLDEDLKRRDREAWVDWEGIPPGDTWEKTIYGAIESTHTFIFVLTPDSIASEVCGREIAHAAANNKRLVPIVHREVVADTVPKSLGELNWIFYRETERRVSQYTTQEGTVEGLQAAMQFDPANDPLNARLGRRLADQAFKQGGDPDEARLARGEADFLTSRALKLAPNNDEIKKPHEEVVKLLQIPEESTNGRN